MAKDIQLKKGNEDAFPKLHIKTKTVTGTTTSNGNLTLNLPLTAVVINVASDIADVAITVYGRVGWWVHCRKSNANNDVLANTDITITVYYLDV